jgi:hypothetical protein
MTTNSALEEYQVWTEAHPAIYPSAILLQDKADAAIAELEAELAVRERMLRLVWDSQLGPLTKRRIDYIAETIGRFPHTDYDGWLADLRARAEEGREP